MFLFFGGLFQGNGISQSLLERCVNGIHWLPCIPFLGQATDCAWSLALFLWTFPFKSKLVAQMVNMITYGSFCGTGPCARHENIWGSARRNRRNLNLGARWRWVIDLWPLTSSLDYCHYYHYYGGNIKDVWVAKLSNMYVCSCWKIILKWIRGLVIGGVNWIYAV